MTTSILNDVTFEQIITATAGIFGFLGIIGNLFNKYSDLNTKVTSNKEELTNLKSQQKELENKLEEVKNSQQQQEISLAEIKTKLTNIEVTLVKIETNILAKINSHT
jgi:chromosome segregation ATPase